MFRIKPRLIFKPILKWAQSNTISHNLWHFGVDIATSEAEATVWPVWNMTGIQADGSTSMDECVL